jgi:hypothetical protein
MTGQGITCVAGGSLTAAQTRVTVLDHPAGLAVATALAGHTWRVETAAPGWFVFRHQPSGQIVTVSGRGNTSVILAAATSGTRHHWRIIPYPERRSVVIISRVTGLALTAGSPDAGRSAPVGLTAYHGAAAQHWSFTHHPGASHAFQP